MILRALYDLAHDPDERLLEDPDFEMRPVAWLVRVDEGGKLLGIESTHQEAEPSGKRKPQPKPLPVPRFPTGKSGTRAPAAFLVENSKYVFGCGTADKAVPKDKGREAAERFRNQVQQCADETRDPAVKAIAVFLASASTRVRIPDDAKSNDLFAFVYGPDVDKCVHERPAVRSWWAARRSAGSAEGPFNRCFVTGSTFRGAPLVPLVRRVPGGQSAGAGVVSFNRPAFESHGWEGNDNAPISRGAAEAVQTALNRLLHPEPVDQQGRRLRRRNIRLSEDTSVCYWCRGRSANQFADVLEELLTGDDPDTVGEMYRGLWSGRVVQVADGAFYAITLSGAQGRIILRDWFQSSVPEVAANLARHFSDLDVVRLTPPPKGRERAPRLTLNVLLESLSPNGKRTDIPAPLVADLVAAALRGRPYPTSILLRALERTRAEIGRDKWADVYRRDARVALIKGVLCRLPNPKEVTPAMDPNNNEPGYLFGRLLAVLERLQTTALGDVSASLVDRYFGAASATPRVVFPRLLKLARYHARKALDSERGSSTGAWLERQLDEIVSRIAPDRGGFPAYLDSVQQGLFVIGYHHQRHWLWMDKDARAMWAQTHNAAAPAA
jgi:CRISPR-associated protein Csd1